MSSCNQCKGAGGGKLYKDASDGGVYCNLCWQQFYGKSPPIDAIIKRAAAYKPSTASVGSSKISAKAPKVPGNDNTALITAATDRVVESILAIASSPSSEQAATKYVSDTLSSIEEALKKKGAEATQGKLGAFTKLEVICRESSVQAVELGNTEFRSALERKLREVSQVCVCDFHT